MGVSVQTPRAASWLSEHFTFCGPKLQGGAEREGALATEGLFGDLNNSSPLKFSFNFQVQS